MSNMIAEKPYWPGPNKIFKDKIFKDSVAGSGFRSAIEVIERCQYVWGQLRHGDHTMLDGARWTLHSDGTAFFDATITGGGDDATWVVWEVHLLDNAGVVLGTLVNQCPIADDRCKFVCELPDSAYRYRFLAFGKFDRNLFERIGGMDMRYSCQTTKAGT